MLKKIISGGQTGADQGGLAGAYSLGIATGGTAPKGYRTENGKNMRLKTDYGLVEHVDWRYSPRTKQNVMDADGTIWVGNLGSPGYYCTKVAAHACNKPWHENPTPEALCAWVEEHHIRTLNVAGNRESTNPGIYERTKQLIISAFEGWNG